MSLNGFLISITDHRWVINEIPNVLTQPLTWQNGCVGGRESFKQHDTGQEHDHEDNPGAQIAWIMFKPLRQWQYYSWCLSIIPAETLHWIEYKYSWSTRNYKFHEVGNILEFWRKSIGKLAPRIGIQCRNPRHSYWSLKRIDLKFWNWTDDYTVQKSHISSEVSARILDEELIPKKHFLITVC